MGNELLRTNLPGMKGLKPEASVAEILFAETITAHMTGSPVTAVKPSTVTWQSV
jgi:hypothetical protein